MILLTYADICILNVMRWRAWPIAGNDNAVGVIAR